MLYYYLRHFYVIFAIFGINKPFVSITGKSKKISIWNYIWCLIVITSMITGYVFTTDLSFSSDIKQKLNLFYATNNMMVNILIIILNAMNGEKVCVKLYDCIIMILQYLKINNMHLKMISIKFYFGFTVSSTCLIVLIVFDAFKSNSFVIVYSLVTYLSFFHLVLHLCIVLSSLKVVKYALTIMLTLDEKVSYDTFMQAIPSTISKAKYILDFDMYFMEIEKKKYLELRFLCKVYDNLSTCIQLLEEHHGIQIILTFWLMFTNAVLGMTMIACDYVNYPILVVGGCLLPFIWCFYGCYTNNQISAEVDDIDMCIVKYLIDFRCDSSRKVILQAFKQLVSTNRLQFTACNLFHLDYSMILALVVNVITYSIILIQLFLTDTK